LNKILWALPLCVVVTGCDRSPVDPHGLESGETLLTVTGTGRTEAAPDQALFTAGLSSVAADAKSASAKNAEAMSRITAALARLNAANGGNGCPHGRAAARVCAGGTGVGAGDGGNQCRNGDGARELRAGPQMNA
jgi:hypothetical protein